mgnify:CR=1 FL=1
MAKFNKESNGYIIGFALMLTLIAGGVLTALTLILGPIQKKEIEFERKKFILGTAFGTETIAVKALENKANIENMYANQVEGLVVNSKGDKVEGVAGKINLKKERVKPMEERNLPLYIVKGDDGKVVAYVMPMYGDGLWDNIWGYAAVEADKNTIKGVVFDHKGETPGLGARITDTEVQQRYIGKKILGEDGKFVSVAMAKGEGQDFSNDQHKLNGLSGATITANGVNDMFSIYLQAYLNYLKK